MNTAPNPRIGLEHVLPAPDRISIVDFNTQALRSTIQLQPGDEPGRSVEDAQKHVHVALLDLKIGKPDIRPIVAIVGAATTQEITNVAGSRVVHRSAGSWLRSM